MDLVFLAVVQVIDEIQTVCLYHRLRADHPVPEVADLYTGVLGQGFELLAAAVSPLWP